MCTGRNGVSRLFPIYLWEVFDYIVYTCGMCLIVMVYPFDHSHIMLTTLLGGRLLTTPVLWEISIIMIDTWNFWDVCECAC